MWLVVCSVSDRDDSGGEHHHLHRPAGLDPATAHQLHHLLRPAWRTADQLQQHSQEHGVLPVLCAAHLLDGAQTAQTARR